MATHERLRIKASQASNMSAQGFSYSEIKQVAKDCHAVGLNSNEVVTAKTLFRWLTDRNKLNECLKHNINFSTVTWVTKWR